MPKQPKEKSTHLQELEAVFDRRTRRFSPFAVLGLNRPEQDSVDSQAESAPGGDHPPTHLPTHIGVGRSTSSGDTSDIGFTGPTYALPTEERMGGWHPPQSSS